MKLLNPVEWSKDVQPCWLRAAAGYVNPNADIRSAIPADTRWYAAEFEEQDTEQLHVFGSADWLQVYGALTLSEIAAASTAGTDPYRHRERIRGIEQAIVRGDVLEPLIVVAPELNAPMMPVDGNHRAIALSRQGRLAGHAAFLGVHPRVATDLVWYRFSIAFAARQRRPA